MPPTPSRWRRATRGPTCRRARGLRRSRRARARAEQVSPARILVVVASTQTGPLRTEVGKGSMRTAIGHGLVDPERRGKLPWRRVCDRFLDFILKGEGSFFFSLFLRLLVKKKYGEEEILLCVFFLLKGQEPSLLVVSFCEAINKGRPHRPSKGNRVKIPELGWGRNACSGRKKVFFALFFFDPSGEVAATRRSPETPAGAPGRVLSPA